MDLIQTVATITLMTLLIYFIMVNVLEKTSPIRDAVPSSGIIKDATGGAEAAKAEAKAETAEIVLPLKTTTGESAGVVVPQVETANHITNKLNLNFGYHDRTTIGGPAPPGGENVTTLAVFNEKQKGILPSNHDLFEKPADFGSDVTNINQFYKNNPDVFKRSSTYVPDTVTWEDKSQELYDAQLASKHQGPINASNFESNPGYDLPK